MIFHTLWCVFEGNMFDKIQKRFKTATGCKLSLKVFHMVKKLIRIFGSWKTKPLFEHTSHHTVFLIFREVGLDFAYYAPYLLIRVVRTDSFSEFRASFFICLSFFKGTFFHIFCSLGAAKSGQFMFCF